MPGVHTGYQFSETEEATLFYQELGGAFEAHVKID